MTQREIEIRLSQTMTAWSMLNDVERLACCVAYQCGYDDGFQVGQIAERGIHNIESKLNEINTEHPGAPFSKDLANSSGAGESSVLMKIYEIVKP